MPITEEQREARRSWLGASDMAAIMTGRAYQIWLNKVYKIDIEISDAMRAGSAVEDCILDWAEIQLGEKLDRQCLIAINGTPIKTHVDGVGKDSGEPVESKSSGLVGPVSREYGMEYTDQIPGSAIVQCQCHMMATRKHICHVPVLLGGIGFRLYTVPFNADLCRAILARANDFWGCVVDKCEPPLDWDTRYDYVIDALKRIKRKPNKIVHVDEELIQQWNLAKTMLNEAKEVETKAKALLIKSLGDAEQGVNEDGSISVTYFTEERNTLKAALIKAQRPDLYEQYCNRISRRVLRSSRR